MKEKLLALVLGALSPVLALSPELGAEASGQPAIEEWKKSVEGVLDELKNTVRSRDQVAFYRQLAGFIEKGALPRESFLGELRALLRIAPPGIVLNALVRKLVDDRSPEAMNILFEGLARRDFLDPKGQDLGEAEREARRRIIEYYLLRLGDRYFQKSATAEQLSISLALEEKLVRELSSEDARRVRAAAYLLGGAARKPAAEPLAQASTRWDKNPYTQAILMEALGRVDPQGGAAVLEGAAASRSELVRCAALPWLGLSKSEKSEPLIREALESAKWALRRAAVEACQNRRDRFAMDLLVARYPRDTPRLQRDIRSAMLDITGGVLPPDPRDWEKWWKLGRENFAAKPRSKDPADDRLRTVGSSQLQYFGFEVHSNHLALVLDVSSSMSSSNLDLGNVGVTVEGTLKEGSPIAIAKDQLKTLLKKVGTRSHFNIIAYSEKVKPFRKTLVPSSRANVQAASKFVEGLKADGATNVYAGLMAAFGDENVDTIYLLSDGAPTDGVRTEPDDILEGVVAWNRFRKTRINAIQLGEDQELMQELAASSGGTYRLLEVGAAVKSSAEPPP